jgi:hypothetical protein
MGHMPPIPGEESSAQSSEVEGKHIPKTIGRALRIWWAVFWRKAILFAIFVAALLWSANALYQKDAIPFWLFRNLTEFGPYVINYAAALLVLRFVLRKKFRHFHIALLALQSAESNEVLAPTFARALRIWWTYTWRTFVYCIGVYFVVSLPLGLLVATLGSIFPRLNDVFAYSAALAIEGGAGLFVIYSNILDEDFGDLRVCLHLR